TVPAPSRPAASEWKNDWAHGAVFYEVFVRSFQDSDGDGKGDLKGLISRLDLLNDGRSETTTDLGVDALWLMPVFESPSYHGYDTTDYGMIEPDYGTNADFLRLLDEAHRRGIRVIVDLVVNHSGVGHPWFASAASSTTSPTRDFYVWSPTDPGWKQPWGGNTGTWHRSGDAYYYGVFWSGMPDLNWRSPALREEVKRIASLWLDRGVDGFRLDATRYLVENGSGPLQADTPETHSALKEFAAHVRRVKPEALLIGENWADTKVIATYYGSPSVPGGDELPASFNFPLSERILTALAQSNATPIASKLDEVQKAYPKGALDAPFLTNHDQTRLATQLGKNQGRLRNAAAILLTVPGAPFLYYGEEVGIENGPTGGDESKRTPMPWDASSGGGFTTGTPWFGFAPGRETANVAAQSNDPASLLSRYRDLIRARKAAPALAKGELVLLSPLTGTTPALAFLRKTTDETVLVVHNLSDGFVSAGPYAVNGTSFERVFVDGTAGDPSGSPGSIRVNLPARGTGIWRVR
ncbi:MAG TPA: alpha-amylase family glycosyl hydrolase, partial [Thermoanaerobaculia bacterium]|nr:alpha-amylase family glycosyl hydrolase [Thermoanaerobaculia bacterium]